MRDRDKLYGRRWREARASFLTMNPLCRMCQAQGKLVAATVVDHILKHDGDAGLFWRVDNWQPLCKVCHDSTKQAEERRGFALGHGLDGRPIDARHPWHRGTQDLDDEGGSM